MTKDFDNFWAWHVRNYPLTTLTRESALEQYNQYFSCTCDGCIFRKEHGEIPMRVHPECKLPLEPFAPNPYP